MGFRRDWMTPREDGRRAATHLMDLPDYTTTINRGDTFCHDLAVIPLKASFPMLRTSSFTPSNNDELLGNSLDLIDERREKAVIQLAYYHQKLKQGYDANVKLKPLAPRDLVMRKVVGVAKNPSWGKLGPNWEGQYRITLVAGIGAYYLEDLDEKAVPRLWNVNNLKRY